ITISENLESQVREKAQAEGITVEVYIERLIREDRMWQEALEPPLEDADSELTEIHAAVFEGLAQAARGEGRPAGDVFAKLRAKHGISRCAHSAGRARPRQDLRKNGSQGALRRTLVVRSHGKRHSGSLHVS